MREENIHLIKRKNPTFQLLSDRRPQQNPAQTASRLAKLTMRLTTAFVLTVTGTLHTREQGTL